MNINLLGRGHYTV